MDTKVLYGLIIFKENNSEKTIKTKAFNCN